MTAWDRAARRFIGDGLRDEHGRALGYLHPMVGGNPALPTVAPDMTTYTIRRSGNSLIVGKPTEGTVRHFDAHHPIGPGGATPVDRFISFDPRRTGRHTGSLQEAAARQDGTMSLVDASLIVDRDQPPRLCSTGQRFDHVPFSPCPSTAPGATGVHPQATDNAISAIRGPLLLRFRHGEFYDVTAFGNGAAGFYNLVNGDEPAPAD